MIADHIPADLKLRAGLGSKMALTQLPKMTGLSFRSWPCLTAHMRKSPLPPSTYSPSDDLEGLPRTSLTSHFAGEALHKVVLLLPLECHALGKWTLVSSSIVQQTSQGVQFKKR